MRHCTPFTWVCLAVSLLSGLADVGPALAQPRKPVSDWIALGNRQLSHGRPGAALLVFGEVEARDPGFAPAQKGLQRSFARFGPVGRGEGFLRYALAEDPGHERALLAAWQALDRANPLRFFGSASILPSSNVDHVASERYLVTDFGTFLIDGGGNETTGVGLGYSVGLEYFIHSRPGSRVRLRAAYSGAWFHAPTLRYGEPSLAIAYERLGGRAPWSLEAYVSRRRYGGTALDITADNSARGLDFRKAWRPPGGGRVRLRLGADYRQYAKKPYLSGPTYDFDLSRLTRLGARGHLSYGLHLQRALPRTGYHRYAGAKLRVAYGRPVAKGLQITVSLGLGQRLYDAAFPIVGQHRRDRTLSIGLGAQLNRIRIFGQSPRFRCTAWRTRSNIALYTINSVDCAMTLTVDF